MGPGTVLRSDTVDNARDHLVEFHITRTPSLMERLEPQPIGDCRRRRHVRLGFASTMVLRRGAGRCSWFPGAGCNQTEIQEPVSEVPRSAGFAVRQENED
jgi:hypothetical protein